MGHFQPKQPRLASGLMSAAGLIAAVRSTDAGSSVSASRRHHRHSFQKHSLLAPAPADAKAASDLNSQEITLHGTL
jgi:hypothetical protein